MCRWKDVPCKYGRGRVIIPAQVIRDACQIIWQAAQQRQLIDYSTVIDQLKARGHHTRAPINRITIGKIVGEVSDQVSQNTNPSVYPSAIVVRRGTNRPGKGFWGLSKGTNPPSRVPSANQRAAIRQYQNDVFTRKWACNC